MLGSPEPANAGLAGWGEVVVGAISVSLGLLLSLFPGGQPTILRQIVMPLAALTFLLLGAAGLLRGLGLQ